MGPTRKRELLAAIVVVAIVGYLLVSAVYLKRFPPITVWTGLSLLVVAGAEAGWAFYVRSKINAGEIGEGSGRVHPLSVARSVTVAKASAWVGAVALGWWIAVVAFVVPRRGTYPVAAADAAGAVVAAVSAAALVVAALWLQHCCKSPPEPPDRPDGVPE
jgi:Protein of unknown function (DUF3180)